VLGAGHPFALPPADLPPLPFAGLDGAPGVPWDARGARSEGGEGECWRGCGGTAHAAAPPSSRWQLGYAHKLCSLLCARVTQAWGRGDPLDHPVPRDCQDPHPSMTSWWVPPGRQGLGWGVQGHGGAGCCHQPPGSIPVPPTTPTLSIAA